MVKPLFRVLDVGVMDRHLFQGPGPPWCVGSFFGTRQLKSGAEAESLGPLLFHPVDEPQQLLFTGCKLQLFDDPFVHPVEQSGYLFEDPSVQYAPGSLINGLLQEDVLAKLAMIHDSNHVFGNRLECLTCSDGKLQLIFPVGENINSLGSILCQRDDSSGRWCPIKKEADEPDLDWLDGVRLSVSLSLSQPIRQLTALKDPSSNLDESFVLTRTAYQVHVTNVQREDDRVCFASRSVKSHRKGVSHVTWNPHIHGELATVLESGEVFVYDVQSTKECTDNLRENFVVGGVDYRRKTRSASTRAVRFTRALQSQIDQLQSSWWRCEYGWHPRNLLIANSEEISLFDLRANQDKTVVATIDGTRKFCHSHHSADDRFVALVRSDYDTLYHLATATEQHLLLYDMRRPRTPLLQWEHRMRDDFPGFLSIMPLSTLRGGEETAASAAGRVIIASSFRSGDVRCFCYGPQAPAASIVSGASSRFRDIEEGYCAWQLPSKLFTSRLRDDCWMNVFKTSAYMFTRQDDTYDKIELDFAESLSGLAVVPNAKNGFGLMQLTGSGGVLSQNYTPSRTLKKPIKTVEPPSKVTGKSKPAVKHANLCFVMNYVKHGHVSARKLTESTDPQTKRPKVPGILDSEKYRKLVYQALEDVDIFLSTYEVAYKVLLIGLPESQALVAAAMPSSVNGYLKRSNRSPYLPPPSKVLMIEENQVPFPLPFLLRSEAGGDIQLSSDRRCNYFEECCELVEEVASELREHQEDTTLGDEEGTKKRFIFHSTAEDSATGSSKIRSQKFIGEGPSSEDAIDSSGVSLFKLWFKSEGDYEPGELNHLENLRQDVDEWLQSVAPYTRYCNENRVS